MSLLFPVRYWRNIMGVYLFLCATKKGVKYRIYCRTYDNSKNAHAWVPPKETPIYSCLMGPVFFLAHIASTESAKSRNETQLFGRKTPATFHKYSQRTVFFLSSAMFLFCFTPCALTASGIPAPPRCLRPCRPAGPTDSLRNFPVLGRRL